MFAGRVMGSGERRRNQEENAEEIKRDKNKKGMNYQKRKWSKSSGADVQTG
jgi:hypothetical protein